MGTSRPPAGIRKPSATPPKAAISSVPAKSCQTRPGNQGTSGVAIPGAPTHSRATTDAMAATSRTRMYCMNATNRASSPKAPAISIITEAPPGAMPHTAVVPGTTFRRVRTKPMAVLMTMMAITTLRNSGQSLRKVSTMSPLMACATRQPTMVCEAKTGRRGGMDPATVAAHDECRRRSDRAAAQPAGEPSRTSRRATPSRRRGHPIARGEGAWRRRREPEDRMAAS